MKVDLWTALWCLLALIAMGLFIGYHRLVESLGKADQILPLWEYIAELPVLGLFVDRLYTMLIKVTNPYSRSIGTSP
jgi:hypothetical protein